MPRYRALLEVSASAAADRDPAAVMGELPARLRRVARFDCLALFLHDPARNTLRLYLLDGFGPRASAPVFEAHAEEAPAGIVWQTQRPWVHPEIAGETRFPRLLDLLRAQGVRSVCAVPLSAAGRRLGVLLFGGRGGYAYSESETDFLVIAAAQVAVAMGRALDCRRLEEVSEQLARERRYLEEETGTEYAELVGQSEAWKRVLREVETAAAADATVLIRGERGSGTELVARAIHNLSRRRGRAFARVQCGTYAGRPLESQFFGEERGFAPPEVGLFELAGQGTVFLDEIGDVPLDLQPRLLRVLQERELERLGGVRTIRVDVRVIAATSRDLPRMVAAREFRSDLFYRINVFPLAVPPLRDRLEDVPLLVAHFARKFARRMNRPVLPASDDDLRALARRPWPGNVRELANLVERAVLLSEGPELRFTHGDSPAAPRRPAPEPPATLQEAERQYILRTLRECRWLVGGPAGAAARLGMKRTTLQSRMQKLGIRRGAAAAE